MLVSPITTHGIPLAISRVDTITSAQVCSLYRRLQRDRSLGFTLQNLVSTPNIRLNWMLGISAMVPFLPGYPSYTRYCRRRAAAQSNATYGDIHRICLESGIKASTLITPPVIQSGTLYKHPSGMPPGARRGIEERQKEGLTGCWSFEKANNPHDNVSGSVDWFFHPS